MLPWSKRRGKKNPKKKPPSKTKKPPKEVATAEPKGGERPDDSPPEAPEPKEGERPDDSPPEAPPDPDSSPRTPELGKARRGPPSKLHVLGDLHGWAPGLINYLISHQLAEVKVGGVSLGSKGRIDEDAMQRIFESEDGRIPPGGLSGTPGFQDALNDGGIGPIEARWKANASEALVQIGDVFDRANHSEVAAEILRQLIIDAPNRVFVLVGNHEQFMIEGSADNWLMNEERNAVKSLDDVRKPSEDSGVHHRLLPVQPFDSHHQRGLEAVFPCYRNSVYTLFLTQAAAQQASGLIDRGVDDELVESMLSPGWKPYEFATRFCESVDSEKTPTGTSIPGALVAIVVGENLLHHAEPGEHLDDLPGEMAGPKSDWLGWVDYSYGGGSIQGSRHSNLLWTRESANGARNGSPRAEERISGLTEKWPGLYRIIHGHSPTPSQDEFFGEMVEGSYSTTCSYLAEKQSSTPKRGTASGIRVYNVDEGMSPVYFSGTGRNDPSRTPVGLRVVDEADLRKPVVAHVKDDDFLEIKKGRDVRRDTRKLWAWSPGQARTTGQYWLEASPQQGGILEFDDSVWIVKADGEGADLLGRRFSGYDLVPNLIRSVIRECSSAEGVKLGGWLGLGDPDEPISALEFVGPPVSHLLEGKPSKAAIGAGLQAIGFSNTGQWTIVNAKKAAANYELHSKSEDKRLGSPPLSVRTGSIEMPGAFSISHSLEEAMAALKFWLAESEEEPNTPTFSLFPSKSAKLPKIHNNDHQEIPSQEKTPPGAEEKPTSPGQKTPSENRGPSERKGLASGLKDFVLGVPQSKSPKGTRSGGGSVADQVRRKSGGSVADQIQRKSGGSVADQTQPSSLIGTEIDSTRIKLDVDQLNQLFKLCGIGTRSKNAKPVIIKINVEFAEQGQFQFSVHQGMKKEWAWNWPSDAGLKHKRQNVDGIEGKKLVRLFGDPEFQKWAREWNRRINRRGEGK